MTKRKKGLRPGHTTSVATGAVVLGAIAVARRRRSGGEDAGLRAHGTITVNRPPEEVYAYWRDFANLPSFMWHLESVRVGDDRSHWVARAPAGKRVAWDAEIERDVPGQCIAWKSVGKTAVPNAGSVTFRRAPKDSGTEVSVELRYDPPGGRAGAAVAKVFGEEPEQQVRDDLRRFKQVIETGEVARSDATPEGTRAIRQMHLLQRPGQPVT